MNVLYLSPAFPPTARHFCQALRNQGARVFGIGDEPLAAQDVVRTLLDDYLFEPHMADYEVLRGAVASMVAQHGKFDRIDSNGEHWLEAEARLRGDFVVSGLQLSELQRQRSKFGMAELFSAASVPYPATLRANRVEEVRAFAREHGFPLVFKPEVGSGAVNTFSVENDRELEQALRQPLDRHLVQPFIQGNIITYDGLANRDGDIVFATSHRYDVGIMQLRQARSDGHYYSLLEVPPALSVLGERCVRAFDVRERFFHIEFFERPDGSYVALEMNLRPPGGFTTDMMSYAADMDVYALYAAALTGERLHEFHHQVKYHTAHAGRRQDRSYRLTDNELRRTLGDTLVASPSVPPAFADTMGDTAYLLRHQDLHALQAAISLVQAV
jgi:carbamoylphosphate synthase large subunit